MKHTHTLKEFFWPITQNKRFFLMGIIYPVLSGIFAPAVVYFFQHITATIEIGDWTQTKTWLGIFVVFVILNYSLRWATKTYPRNGLPTVLATLHRKYIAAYIQLDNTATEKIGTGKFVSIINKGMDTWADGIASVWNQGWKLSVAIIGALLIIASIDRRLALGALLAFASVIQLIIYLDRKAVFRRNQRRDHEHDHTEHMIKIVMSKYEVMQAGSTAHEIDKLDHMIEGAKEKNIHVSHYITAMFYIPRIILDLLKVGLVLIVGHGVVQGTHNYADFVAILGAIYVLESVIDKGVQFFKDITKNITYVYKMLDIFADAPTMRHYDHGQQFVHRQGDIVIQGLGFGYDKQHIFDNFCVQFAGGKKTALVGASGSGKTTLMKLIAGYITPQSGSILIDGQPLPTVQKIDDHNSHTTISLKSYYKHIGYLTQEPMIFDGSIYENLTYALGRTQEQGKHDNMPQGTQLKALITDTIELSQCQFIYDLPEGIHTQIGERGIRLSGGQRQRLAIAKIMLKNPSIILLDEPTSALDSFAEDAVTIAMNNLFEGRTVIIIAHRLQTVKHADDIIVLNQGEIIERGTHQELLTAQGHYAQMLELQSGF